MPGNIDWTDELEAAADAVWSGIVVSGQPEVSQAGESTDVSTE